MRPNKTDAGNGPDGVGGGVEDSSTEFMTT